MSCCIRSNSKELDSLGILEKSHKKTVCKGRCIKAGAFLVPIALIALVCSATYAFFKGIQENEESEGGSAPLLFSSISVLTGVLIASIVAEVKNSRKSYFKNRLIPAPTLIALAFSVTGVVITFRAAIETTAYTINQSKIEFQVSTRVQDCVWGVETGMKAFTKEPCTTCFNSNSQWKPNTDDEPMQQVFVDDHVDETICDPIFPNNETLPVSWFRDIFINDSLFNDWPCHVQYLDDQSSFGKTVLYLGNQRGLFPPEKLKLEILNDSCITVAGFATRRFSLPNLCRLNSPDSLPYDLAMPCQNNYSVTYFNTFRDEIAKIRNASLPIPDIADSPFNNWAMIALVPVGMLSVLGECYIYNRRGR